MTKTSEQDVIPTVALDEFSQLDEGGALAVAEMVDSTLRRIGFLRISGHGVPEDLVSGIYTVSRDFFALSDEVKAQYRTDQNGILGFRPAGTLRASTSAPDAPYDLKEIFTVGNEVPEPRSPEERAFFPANIWPTEVVELQRVFGDYYQSMRGLVGRIGPLLAAALDVRHDYFTQRTEHQLSWLASINYPYMDTAAPGQVRFGAHRDRSCFTILSTTGPGLEVEDEDGTWHSVGPVPGTFIVNVGSMLSRWTGDRWAAPRHRVVPPGGDVADGPRARQSIVFFYSPEYDVTIDPTDITAPGDSPTQAPITVAEHLHSMLGLYK